MLIDTPQGPIEFPDDTPKDVIEKQIAAMLDTYEGQDENAGNFGQQVLQGATFNLADEGMAAVAAGSIKTQELFSDFMDMLTGTKDTSLFGKEKNRKSFGELYDQGRNEFRSDMNKYERENPGKAFAGQLAGGLATGIASGAKVLGSQMVKQGSKTVKALAVPTFAGAEGAAYGFGEGETLKERVTNMPKAAAISAVGGTLLNQIAKPIARKLLKKQANFEKEIHTASKELEDLKIEAQVYYKTADESGIKVINKSYTKFKTPLLADLKARAVTGKHYPRISKAIAEIKRLKNPTYKELEGIKVMLKNGRMDNDNATREIANELSTKVDKFIADLTPDMVSKGNVKNLGEHLLKAKDLWHRKAQAELLDEIQEKALLSESVIDANDYDKAIRSGIRTILNSPKKSRGLDDEVITSLNDIVKGGPIKKFTRFFSGMSPGAHTARGLTPAAAGGLTGFATGGPTGAAIGTMAPAVVGSIFKKFAGVASNRELAALKDSIVNKNQKKTEEIIAELMEKYGPSIAGGSAGIAGVSTESVESTLSDMISP